MHSWLGFALSCVVLNGHASGRFVRRGGGTGAERKPSESCDGFPRAIPSPVSPGPVGAHVDPMAGCCPLKPLRSLFLPGFSRVWEPVLFSLGHVVSLVMLNIKARAFQWRASATGECVFMVSTQSLSEPGGYGVCPPIAVGDGSNGFADACFIDTPCHAAGPSAARAVSPAHC